MADLSGILVVDKPPGMTSHDVVSRVRRFVGMKRVGHGGTLDPFATGVLPIAVGRATRILQYVQASEKQYLAHAILGTETDSGDIDGTVVASVQRTDWPSERAVEESVARYVGTIEQVPPALSAIKVDGKPLHRRVRAGEVVEPPPRTVNIHAIRIVSYSPPDLMLDITCGSGTYVRSLVRDIGRALETYAYCHALRRARTGPFSIDESLTLDELARRDLPDEWARVSVGMDAAVTHLPAISLDTGDVNRWYHGRPLTVLDANQQDGLGQVRVYDAFGSFAGIGEIDAAGVLVPRLVVPVRLEAGTA